MKVRVAIYDQDSNYQNRLMLALSESFPESLEVVPCRTQEDLDGLAEKQVSVLAMTEGSNLNPDKVPEWCAMVNLSNTKNSSGDEYQVFKFQKVSEIGKELFTIGVNHEKLSYEKKEADRIAKEDEADRLRIEQEDRERRERIQAEDEARQEKIRLENEKIEEEKRLAEEKARQAEEQAKAEAERLAAEKKINERRRHPHIYSFVSASAKEGGSCVAFACAGKNAMASVSTLFIDLKQYSTSARLCENSMPDIKYSAVLQKAMDGTLSDYELKGSILKDSKTGMDYMVCDACEFEVAMLGTEGFKKLYDEIGKMLKYDTIVVNMGIPLNQLSYYILAKSEKVVLVGSGLAESNQKFLTTIDAIKKYDKIFEADIISHTKMLYNKATKQSATLGIMEVENLGNIPVMKEGFREMSESKIIESMIKLPLFDGLID